MKRSKTTAPPPWTKTEDASVKLLTVCVCVYSVVGPAVTFKVNPNAHNVSTADVASVAGRPSSSNVVMPMEEDRKRDRPLTPAARCT